MVHKLCGPRNHHQPDAGWGVGWTGMGELEYLTCSQVEEGGGVGLGFLCWGPRWEAAAAEAAGEKKACSESYRPGWDAGVPEAAKG